MKKIFLLLAVIMSFSITGVSVAHANLADWMWGCFDFTHNNGDGCGLFLMSFTTFMPVMAPAATSTSTLSDNEKAAYINELRDESAQFIAEDGAEPPSAVLEEAILAVRAMDPTTNGMSDLQVARLLMQ